jgi:hypothetical protein
MGGVPEMRMFLLAVLLSGVLAWGQAKPVPPAQKNPPAAPADDDDRPAPPPPASDVPPTAAVLTIKGLCPSPSARASKGAEVAKSSEAACETVITRAEFEKMAKAIQPSMSPVVKRQLLSLYPRLLMMSHEAEVRGLDKDEYFLKMLWFARIQILTQQLTRRLQEEAGNVSDDDLADYYRKETEKFTQYTLDRVYIPLAEQTPPPEEKLSEEAEKTRQMNAEAEMKKVADALRARAIKGEDFMVLEKEAYQSARLKSDPPTTNLGKVRRNGLPAGQAAVFDLQVGAVSQVFTDAGGHYFYKLEAKNVAPLEEAKAEIRTTLQSQRVKDATDKIQAPFRTEINEEYFGPVSGGNKTSKPAAAPSASTPSKPQ